MYSVIGQMNRRRVENEGCIIIWVYNFVSPESLTRPTSSGVITSKGDGGCLVWCLYMACVWERVGNGVLLLRSDVCGKRSGNVCSEELSLIFRTTNK